MTGPTKASLNGSADPLADRLKEIAGTGDGPDQAATEELPSIDGEPTRHAAATAQNLVESQIQLAMGVIVRGIVVSAPGVPPTVTLPAIARACGKMLAMITDGGTVEGTVKARKEFEAAFKDGMSKVSILRAPNSIAPGQRAG